MLGEDAWQDLNRTSLVPHNPGLSRLIKISIFHDVGFRSARRKCPFTLPKVSLERICRKFCCHHDGQVVIAKHNCHHSFRPMHHCLLSKIQNRTLPELLCARVTFLWLPKFRFGFRSIGRDSAYSDTTAPTQMTVEMAFSMSSPFSSVQMDLMEAEWDCDRISSQF